jgi:hypothetical protein
MNRSRNFGLRTSVYPLWTQSKFNTINSNFIKKDSSPGQQGFLSLALRWQEQSRLLIDLRQTNALISEFLPLLACKPYNLHHHPGKGVLCQEIPEILWGACHNKVGCKLAVGMLVPIPMQ